MFDNIATTTYGGRVCIILMNRVWMSQGLSGDRWSMYTAPYWVLWHSESTKALKTSAVLFDLNQTINSNSQTQCLQWNSLHSMIPSVLSSSVALRLSCMFYEPPPGSRPDLTTIVPPRLYGITTMQTRTYYRHSTKDPRALKITVSICTTILLV